MCANPCTADYGPATADMDARAGTETASGFSSYRSKGERVGRKSVKTHVGSVEEETKTSETRFTRESNSRKRLGSRRSEGTDSKFPSLKSGSKILANKSLKANEKEGKSKQGDGDKGREGMDKGSKKNKVDSQEGLLRVGLEMCSKSGDVMGALELYDSAQREGIVLGQYHYTVLLYLCSSAAIGVIRPAKSGTGSRSLDVLCSSSEVPECLADFRETSKESSVKTVLKIPVSNNGVSVDSMKGHQNKSHQNSHKQVLDPNGLTLEVAKDDLDGSFFEMEKLPSVSMGFNQSNTRILEGQMHLRKGFDKSQIIKKDDEIWVSEDFKKYALQRGFEIYEKMCLEKVPMNEATLTSVARMAMSIGNGDMAFDMVKQMKPLGINPRLRSYGPAISAFCKNGEIEKAFDVEKHMLDHGVYPEVPELEALLRVSIEAGNSDKVYYILHKLRTSVRQVSHSTANLIVKWFKSNAAANAGKRNWDRRLISEAIANGSGGWHGHGWLGRGKWSVSCTTVGANGLCQCCGEKLATIDLDPIETEKFAESVASIAIKRENNSSFQKFQV